MYTAVRRGVDKEGRYRMDRRMESPLTKNPALLTARRGPLIALDHVSHQLWAGLVGFSLLALVSR
jgi:hypothetical protein